MKATCVALTAGWVSIFVSAGSTRASRVGCAAQVAAATTAATRAEAAARSIANGEPVLADVGGAGERAGPGIDHDRLAPAHERAVHDAGWRHDALVPASDQRGDHRRRQG